MEQILLQPVITRFLMNALLILLEIGSNMFYRYYVRELSIVLVFFYFNELYLAKNELYLIIEFVSYIDDIENRI